MENFKNNPNRLEIIDVISKLSYSNKLTLNDDHGIANGNTIVYTIDNSDKFSMYDRLTASLKNYNAKHIIRKKSTLGSVFLNNGIDIVIKAPKNAKSGGITTAKDLIPSKFVESSTGIFTSEELVEKIKKYKPFQKNGKFSSIGEFCIELAETALKAKVETKPNKNDKAWSFVLDIPQTISQYDQAVKEYQNITNDFSEVISAIILSKAKKGKISFPSGNAGLVDFTIHGDSPNNKIYNYSNKFVNSSGSSATKYIQNSDNPVLKALGNGESVVSKVLFASKEAGLPLSNFNSLQEVFDYNYNLARKCKTYEDFEQQVIANNKLIAGNKNTRTNNIKSTTNTLKFFYEYSHANNTPPTIQPKRLKTIEKMGVGIIISPLGYRLVDYLNTDTTMVNVLNDAIRNIVASQVTVDWKIQSKKIYFTVKGFDKATFLFEFTNSIGDPGNNAIKFKMNLSE